MSTKELHLDIGCGVNPTPSPHGAERSISISIDFNHNNLQRAKTAGWSYPLVLADAKALPFQDNTFDTVSCHHLIEHVDKRYKVLTEINRVTKTTGEVDISVPHPFFDLIMATVLFGYYPYWSEKNHVYVFTPNRLIGLMSEADFVIKAVKQRGWWRAVTTIYNYFLARLFREPIVGQSQRIQSHRQEKLVEHKDTYIKRVRAFDVRIPFLNRILPYEIFVSATKSHDNVSNSTKFDG